MERRAKHFIMKAARILIPLYDNLIRLYKFLDVAYKLEMNCKNQLITKK